MLGLPCTFIKGWCISSRFRMNWVILLIFFIKSHDPHIGFHEIWLMFWWSTKKSYKTFCTASQIFPQNHAARYWDTKVFLTFTFKSHEVIFISCSLKSNIETYRDKYFCSIDYLVIIRWSTNPQILCFLSRWASCSALCDFFNSIYTSFNRTINLFSWSRYINSIINYYFSWRYPILYLFFYKFRYLFHLEGQIIELIWNIIFSPYFFSLLQLIFEWLASDDGAWIASLSVYLAVEFHVVFWDFFSII